jgi:hypothetical protein
MGYKCISGPTSDPPSLLKPNFEIPIPTPTHLTHAAAPARLPLPTNHIGETLPSSSNRLSVHQSSLLTI